MVTVESLDLSLEPGREKWDYEKWCALFVRRVSGPACLPTPAAAAVRKYKKIYV